MQWLWIVNTFVWYSLLPRAALLCRGQSSLLCNAVMCHDGIAWHGVSSSACPIIRVNIAPSPWADHPHVPHVKVSRVVMIVHSGLRSHSHKKPLSPQSSLTFLPIIPCTAVSAMPCNQIGTRIVNVHLKSESILMCTLHTLMATLQSPLTPPV